MSRATHVLGATSVVGLALSLWLYIDNRSLRAELANRTVALRESPGSAASRADPAATPTSGPAEPARPAGPILAQAPKPPPNLSGGSDETRMERRARRTSEIAAMLGRLDGETEDEYRARVIPMLQAGLLTPRLRVDEQRKVAEDKARVSPEQSARLDKAFEKVYGDVIDFTNRAIADGQLSPYERNVSGWLEYAGGLGGILNEANTQIGKILEPSQIRTMSEAGFEWGEYLGLKAPWEQLKAPPLPDR